MALVLFDHGTPAGLRRHLRPHRIDTAKRKGWEEKENGELLDLAEDAGYHVLVTTDRNMHYQQHFAGRKIGLVVLRYPEWPQVSHHASRIAQAIDETGPGQITEVQCGPQPTPKAPQHAAAEAAARRVPTPHERAQTARSTDRAADPGHGHGHED